MVYCCHSDMTSHNALAVLDPFTPSLPVNHFPSLGTSLTLKCVKPRSFPAPEVFWATVMDQERFTPIDLSSRISIDPEGTQYITILHVECILYMSTLVIYVFIKA